MFQSLYRLALEAAPSLRLIAASPARPATCCCASAIAPFSGSLQQLHLFTPFTSLRHDAAAHPSIQTSFSASFSTASTTPETSQQEDPAPPAAATPTPTPSRPASTPDKYASGARKVVNLRRRAAASGMHGTVHVYDAASNMILTFTDAAGRVLTWTSSGSVGYRNARKSLPVAAEKAAEELAHRALKMGYSTAAVKMKGIGNNKQYAVQSLSAAGLQLTQLSDVTPIPYNGCRRPKKRRV